ncbi:vWA domain-containing protein [Nocardia sp. NBC_01327]|uniref:vWA domain-containing protein n=1 Tax=Nocardia sp. NBC_01327 TaxID=2903593 RepID=UPI002E1520EC|nr:VWA domain-containing protein [Nocardia sp. NBC_01327]
MYSAEINRKQPALLMLLVDQSFSMSEPAGQGQGTKADVLALAVNNLLGNAVLLCSRGGEKIYNYFEVGVVGYGAKIGPILHGADAERRVLPVKELADNPRRIDTVARRVPDGAGGVVPVQQQMPVWVDPLADGATPMVSALGYAEPVIASWCAAHPSSFPPMVINVTDGASTDGDPREAADRIRELSTDDGAALVFNLHLSALGGQAVTFPDTAADMTDPNAQRLFEASSVLPPAMLEASAALGYPVRSGSRGFLYNADVTMVIDFLDIGTRAVTPTGLKELITPTDDDAVPGDGGDATSDDDDDSSHNGGDQPAL